MGGQASTCPLDISDYPSQVDGGDPFFNDLWGRGCDSFGNWIPNTEDKFIPTDSNNSLLERSLDLVEERREKAMVQLAYYQQKLKQGYDSSMKDRKSVV